VPNGLTSARFALLSGSGGNANNRTHWCDDKRDPVILLYTRFVEFDPTLVVRVLSSVRSSIPTVTLLVVGASADGSAEVAVRAAARAAGLDDAINWHGWADPAQIAIIAAGADVAIHPFDDTLVNRSKCSVKLLELMAMGIPVVTTNVGENSSFIQDGVSGILAQPGEPDAIARAVVSVLSDPALGRRLGQAAQDRVYSLYLWEHLAPRVADAYLSALGESPT